jgi:hypothetical protein
MAALDGPTYAELPSTFGNGAVGEVPFRVHEPQSDALNTNILVSAFQRSSSGTPLCSPGRNIELEFYGPVAIQPRDVNDPSTRAPVSVEMEVPVDTSNPPDGTPDVFFWTQVSHLMDFTTSGRRLIISAKPGAAFPTNGGTFRVTTWPVESQHRLKCDPASLLVPSSQIVRVAPMVADTPSEYRFILLPDCQPDCTQDTSCGLPLPDWICDPIDFNNDGVFPDSLDFDDFLSVLGAGACSTGDCNDLDFNNDGVFPDSLDQDALLSIIGGGPCLW